MQGNLLFHAQFFWLSTRPKTCYTTSQIIPFFILWRLSRKQGIVVPLCHFSRFSPSVKSLKCLLGHVPNPLNIATRWLRVPPERLIKKETRYGSTEIQWKSVPGYFYLFFCDCSCSCWPRSSLAMSSLTHASEI